MKRSRQGKGVVIRYLTKISGYSRQQLIDFDNGVIYLYRSKVSNDDFIPMTNRLRTTHLNRQKSIEGDYVFPGKYGGHKTIQNNRALEIERGVFALNSRL